LKLEARLENFLKSAIAKGQQVLQISLTDNGHNSSNGGAKEKKRGSTERQIKGRGASGIKGLEVQKGSIGLDTANTGRDDDRKRAAFGHKPLTIYRIEGESRSPTTCHNGKKEGEGKPGNRKSAQKGSERAQNCRELMPDPNGEKVNLNRDISINMATNRCN